MDLKLLWLWWTVTRSLHASLSNITLVPCLEWSSNGCLAFATRAPFNPFTSFDSSSLFLGESWFTFFRDTQLLKYNLLAQAASWDSGDLAEFTWISFPAIPAIPCFSEAMAQGRGERITMRIKDVIGEELQHLGHQAFDRNSWSWFSWCLFESPRLVVKWCMAWQRFAVRRAEESKCRKMQEAHAAANSKDGTATRNSQRENNSKELKGRHLPGKKLRAVAAIHLWSNGWFLRGLIQLAYKV